MSNSRPAAFFAIPEMLQGFGSASPLHNPVLCGGPVSFLRFGQVLQKRTLVGGVQRVEHQIIANSDSEPLEYSLIAHFGLKGAKCQPSKVKCRNNDMNCDVAGLHYSRHPVSRGVHHSLSD